MKLIFFHLAVLNEFVVFYLPLLHETVHFLLCCSFVSPELVFDVLITQRLQIDRQEAMKDQDSLIQRPNLGEVSWSCHDNRWSGPEAK